jgi:hypothetical protein
MINPHSKIRNIELEYDNVVIGSSIEALCYASINNYSFLYTTVDAPISISYFEPGINLSCFGFSDESSTIKKMKLWKKLYYYLSLIGKNILSFPASSIKIEENKIKAYTKNARMAKINFTKLHIFSDKGVSGLPEPIKTIENKYTVYDWFDVKSGMKHDHDILTSDSSFIQKLIFYKTTRLDGDHKLKDAVGISLLSKQELEDFEYSDINARFKALYMMKKAGIRGARNGRDMNDKTKYKYYAVKIENRERQIVNNNKVIYPDTQNIIFNNLSFNDILSLENKSYHPYAAELFK